LILPQYRLSFTPKTLLLTGEKGIAHIDETNFEYLQEAVI
jgi:hypothetical protein